MLYFYFMVSLPALNHNLISTQSSFSLLRYSGRGSLLFISKCINIVLGLNILFNTVEYIFSVGSNHDALQSFIWRSFLPLMKIAHIFDRKMLNQVDFLKLVVVNLLSLQNFIL